MTSQLIDSHFPSTNNLQCPPRLPCRILLNTSDFRPYCFWTTVCKTVHPMLLVRCLSVLSVCLSCLSVCPVLSVTFVHCGQTVGRIKMKLGLQVGLGSGHIALDGDPAPLHQRAQPPNFRPISVADKWLHGSRCHLVWSWASAQATLC